MSEPAPDNSADTQTVPARGAYASAKPAGWYLTYCALAVFTIVALSLSLWLNHREVRALDFSVSSYNAYAKVLEGVAAVGNAVFSLNDVGNDDFLNGAAVNADTRLQASLAAFRAAHEELHTSIGLLSADARKMVGQELAGVESDLELTYADARALQAAIAARQKTDAANYMAAMNSRYNDAVQHLFETGRIVRGEQLAIITVQKRQASIARGFAAALAIVGMVLGVAALAHGRRLNRATKKDALKREQQLRRLSRARDQAEQAARAKARFLATMSHEIRTPMNGVLGMLDALSATALSQSQAGILKTANSSADLLLTMIDDVLDFSLIDAHMLSIKNAPVDLKELTQRTLALYSAPAREKRLSLELELPDDPLDVQTDATRLTQVLCNFLGNSLKFTARGSVRLSLSVLENLNDVVRVKFTVKDTGIGMDQELQSKLFAPFTLGDSGTNRRYGGTGLGLAICRQLAKLLDPDAGEVGVVSSPGAGASFFVILSLKKTAIHTHGAGGPDSLASRTVRKFAGRVLIAEDNDTNRQVMATMLRNLGLQSAIAGNGNEAIAAVQRERFDLILMDYHMPELDGCDATIGIRRYEQMRALTRTPIVAVTASVLVEDRDKCLASGMDDFVAKPVRQRTLVAVLEKWLPADARRDAGDAQNLVESFDQTWTTLPQEIFDVEQLLETRGIAGESFDDLMEQFHSSAVDGLTSIRNALKSGDAVALKRAAHKLKGAAATLGAKTVAERCHALEVIGKEQQMEAAAEQLHCLEQEYLEVRRYIEACARYKTAPAA